MEVKTKFNIGDTIYFMYDNKVCNSSVRSVSVWIGKESTDIKYYMDRDKGRIPITEDESCATKEELIASL
nr:MAG: hypothetical protein [Bacteriophage sp.]